MKTKALSILVLALTAQLSGQSSSSTFSFETDMEGWESDFFVLQDSCATVTGYPECLGHPNLTVDRRGSIQRTTELAYTGTHSLRVFTDGVGLAWISRPFSATPGMRYRVRLSFYVAPLQGASSWDSMLAYTGAARPSGSYPQRGDPNRFLLLQAPDGVVEGAWTRYETIGEVAPDSSGTIWVALGLVGEHEETNNFFFDSVTVSIDPVNTATSTQALGVAPSTGSGRSQAFIFAFSDGKGWQDLGVLNILINNSLSPQNACYLAYVPALDVLYLVNDAGNALLPGIMLGGDNVPSPLLISPNDLSNRQCDITSGNSAVVKASGNTLVLSLIISFGSTFTGNQSIYLAARDTSGLNNTGWITAGTWTVQ
jgi:hypothetical protein